MFLIHEISLLGGPRLTSIFPQIISSRSLYLLYIRKNAKIGKLTFQDTFLKVGCVNLITL